MQHASGRAEYSIQAVSVLIGAFLLDQCPVPLTDISEKQVWRAGKSRRKNQVLPVAFLLIWRLSSTLNKFKDGERQERTARISAWKQQRLKRDQRQPALSSYYFFTPLLIFEKPGPMNVLKMSRSNIILKENKLPLYFLFSTLHEHLPKHCVPCCPGASARPGAARGMTGSLQVTSESSC